jgi:diguanylate cyclase (GGDEF)-like protein
MSGRWVVSGEKPRFLKAVPIGWRLAILVAGIGTILCLSVVLFILPFQYGRVEEEAIGEANILAEAVSTIYQQLGDNQPRDKARRLLLRVARTPYITLINVMDQKGIVRYSTDSRELGRQYEARFGVAREEGGLNVTYMVPDSDSLVGSVSVMIDRDLMLNDTHHLFIQIALGIFLMILLLSFLVKGLVDRLITARLNKLSGLLESAFGGSFLHRAEIDRDDELGRVNLAFNKLLSMITQIEAKSLEEEQVIKNADTQKELRHKLEETSFELERSQEKLKDKANAHELLMEAAHRLGGTLKHEAVVERLINLIKEKISWPQFAIFLMQGKEDHKKTLKLSFSHGFGKDVLNQKVIIGEGLVGMVAQTGSPVVIGKVDKDENLKLWIFDKPIKAIEVKSGSIMAIPMIHQGQVIGVFLFAHPEPFMFDDDDIDLISALGAQTALTLVNAELYETTLELAISDPLTGVYNRRAMVRQIEYELARAQRFHTDVAILLVDVDHFKSYNDRMGHVLGDVVLKEIAKALKESIRKVDTLARFGGEEFCVILPQADLKAAKEVAFKLCEATRALKLRGAEKQELGYLSVSIGIVVVSGDDHKFEQENAIIDIIGMADKALYEAKRLGRDRFIEYTR